MREMEYLNWVDFNRRREYYHEPPWQSKPQGLIITSGVTRLGEVG